MTFVVVAPSNPRVCLPCAVQASGSCWLLGVVSYKSWEALSLLFVYLSFSHFKWCIYRSKKSVWLQAKKALSKRIPTLESLVTSIQIICKFTTSPWCFGHLVVIQFNDFWGWPFSWNSFWTSEMFFSLIFIVGTFWSFKKRLDKVALRACGLHTLIWMWSISTLMIADSDWCWLMLIGSPLELLHITNESFPKPNVHDDVHCG